MERAFLGVGSFSEAKRFKGEGTDSFQGLLGNWLINDSLFLPKESFFALLTISNCSLRRSLSVFVVSPQ